MPFMVLCPDHQSAWTGWSLYWHLDAWILWLDPVMGVSMKEPIDIWPGSRGAAPGSSCFFVQDKEVLCMLVCPSLIMARYSQASFPRPQEMWPREDKTIFTCDFDLRSLGDLLHHDLPLVATWLSCLGPRPPASRLSP